MMMTIIIIIIIIIIILVVLLSRTASLFYVCQAWTYFPFISVHIQVKANFFVVINDLNSPLS
jgi:hypothetical protein